MHKDAAKNADTKELDKRLYTATRPDAIQAKK